MCGHAHGHGHLRKHTQGMTVRISPFIPGEGERVERNEAGEVTRIQFVKDLCHLMWRSSVQKCQSSSFTGLSIFNVASAIHPHISVAG